MESLNVGPVCEERSFGQSLMICNIEEEMENLRKEVEETKALLQEALDDKMMIEAENSNLTTKNKNLVQIERNINCDIFHHYIKKCEFTLRISIDEKIVFEIAPIFIRVMALEN